MASSIAFLQDLADLAERIGLIFFIMISDRAGAAMLLDMQIYEILRWSCRIQDYCMLADQVRPQFRYPDHSANPFLSIFLCIQCESVVT